MQCFSYPQEPIIFFQLHNISAVVRPHAYNIFLWTLESQGELVEGRKKSIFESVRSMEKYENIHVDITGRSTHSTPSRERPWGRRRRKFLY